MRTNQRISIYTYQVKTRITITITITITIAIQDTQKKFISSLGYIATNNSNIFQVLTRIRGS